MKCLSSTLFPEPERPMMASVSPSRTSSETSRSTGRPSKLLERWRISIKGVSSLRSEGRRSMDFRPSDLRPGASEQHDGADVVGEEDEDAGEHGGLRRRGAHALGAAAGVVPLVAGDRRDGEPEHERLD